MKPILKMTFLCLGTSVLSICISQYLFILGLGQLGNLTLKSFHKFLIVNLSMIDTILLCFFPIILGTVFILHKSTNYRLLLKIILQTFLTLILSVVAGIFFAIVSWEEKSSNPLLPEYIRYQPFSFYWTLFICLGIFIPITYYFLKKKLHPSSHQ